MANLGYIQVTRICNQHCLFCSNPENQRVLALEQAQAQIESLIGSGYHGVILTGGEPTMHPELAGIVGMAREGGINVRIITNGQKTADRRYLKRLADAGLDHLHVSVHSSNPGVQAFLTGNEESWENISATLENIGALGLHCDINTVMCAQNADHLSLTVKTIFKRFPFVRHFVWNNIDSKMNRVVDNPGTVARLANLELELARAIRFLEERGCTYRIERLPLCYMVEFAHASTETRKMIKQEERTVHFLDEKGKIQQTSFQHDKAPVCRHCTLDSICAGLYDLGGAYDPKELYPVFLDKQTIVAKILNVP
jgi:MoaA/NifB/PqqE/SkfB family radical SAM enzyme